MTTYETAKVEATEALAQVLLKERAQLADLYLACPDLKTCAKMVYADLSKFMGESYFSSKALVEKIRVYADFETACRVIIKL